MLVWIAEGVREVAYGGDEIDIIGVFSTEEKAKAACEKYLVGRTGGWYSVTADWKSYTLDEVE